MVNSFSAWSGLILCAGLIGNVIAGTEIAALTGVNWELALEANDAAPAKKPHHVARAEKSAPPEIIDANGVRTFVWRSVGDGTNSWPVEVTLERRQSADGLVIGGRIVNRTPDLRVFRFAGPRFENVVTKGAPTLYVAHGLGARLRKMPSGPKDFNQAAWVDLGSGVFRCDAAWRGFNYWYPGPCRTMQYLALEGAGETLYLGSHDRNFDNKDLQALYDTKTKSFTLVVEHVCAVGAGTSYDLPPTVLEKLPGDWHAAARRYRRWSDTVFTPIGLETEGRDISGWLLVILKQQNREIIWPYTDFAQLADVAVAHGLDTIGLFGWTAFGHDNCYPDYRPCPEMGGRDALVRGIRLLRERGLRVFNYANGQLQERGTTEYWRTIGCRRALVRADGKPDGEVWHKYASAPAHAFDLACLYSEEWFDRMLAQARQAADLGLDGILYDQLASVQSRRCYGQDHGHPVGLAVQAGERVRFVRRLNAAMQAVKPGFQILTEGFADCETDAISIFHGCEPGVFSDASWLDTVEPSRGRDGVTFPEFVRYTFPELVTTTRVPSPMSTRSMANFAVLLGLRHDVEVRYAPDRQFVTTGRIPALADYGDILSKPNLSAMRTIPQREAQDYLKSVNLFARKHAKYLLRGTFVDTDGFSLSGTHVQAKGYRAADGTFAVILWNTDDKTPAAFRLKGPTAPQAACEPGRDDPVDPHAELTPNTLRLVIFGVPPKE